LQVMQLWVRRWPVQRLLRLLPVFWRRMPPLEQVLGVLGEALLALSMRR